MKMYLYELFCDDDSVVIMGEKELDLSKAVQTALDSLTNDDILHPQNDWFELTVDIVCEQNGFKRIEMNGVFDVEEAYWDEHHKREDQEYEDEDDCMHNNVKVDESDPPTMFCYDCESSFILDENGEIAE